MHIVKIMAGVAMAGVGAYMAFFDKKEESSENNGGATQGIRGTRGVRGVLAPTVVDKMKEKESSVSNQVSMNRLV